MKGTHAHAHAHTHTHLEAVAEPEQVREVARSKILTLQTDRNDATFRTDAPPRAGSVYRWAQGGELPLRRKWEPA